MHRVYTAFLAIGMLFIASCSSDKGTNPDDKDKYVTVTIGKQAWMQKNLDVSHYRNGDPIFQAKTDEQWQQAGEQGIGAWCYYDNAQGLGAIYGKLYNWYAVNDPRGLAPEGWRVPSHQDWKDLEMAMGMTHEQADSWDWNRGSSEGSKLAGDYDLWSDGELRNHPHFNSSGFSGLPGGERNYDGNFAGRSDYAHWWSSTEYNSSIAHLRFLSYNNTHVGKHHFAKRSGYSVRCIRD